jgi:soluble lytic murein transglycosylase
MRLGRADRLAAARQYARARAEYFSLSTSLPGLLREQAAVRVGVSDYNLGRNLIAYRFLRTLKVTQPDAVAERLYHLAAAARRLKRIEEFTETVEAMGRSCPTSPWYEEALFSAGNQYLLDHQPERYLSYYRTLYESFPKGRYAENAHWKVAWHAYQNRETAGQADQARRLLEEHARLYASGAQASGAVYWLGRLAESRSDWATARSLYSHLAARYPLYYHTLLAQERIGKLPPQATPATAVTPELAGPAARPAREPIGEVKRYLDRASLLAQLGFADLAEQELRFRAESEPLAYHAGLELARMAASRGEHFRAIRLLKRYTPGYLGYTVEAMPPQYWELLFPLP